MAQPLLYSSESFQVYSDRVVQGKNEAKAFSDKHLVSNYQSPVNLNKPAELVFKFGINGADNEMPPGMDHQFSVALVNGKAETPMIEFGKKLLAINNETAYMPPNAPVRFRLDFRKPLQEMKDKGFFECYNGTKIYQSDFKGVFIAGASSPLSWDFDNLGSRQHLKLQDPDGDGIYEIELVFNVHSEDRATASEWKPLHNLDAFPRYHSPFVLTDALYNLAIDEMIGAIEPDNTFRTGKEWAGVWTRDISYSIILSMAILQPEVAKISLRKKVKNKTIIQDTGTGGAWPVSTDRMIWATAAYEIYLVTGEKDWLAYAFEVVKNSLETDLKVAIDPSTGLVMGESSFLDWREQTYPRWMQPADIFESVCLGTNAVHFQAHQVLAAMATELGNKKLATDHEKVAKKIKEGINQHLWNPATGYYGQFLYGRSHKIRSPKSEALGEALCILFGIADEKRTKEVITKTPVNEFGIPCISPQIPGIPPYHNQAVWPFVQSYWALAAAKANHEASLMHSFASIYRPAALFLTNKENFVLSSGDFAGTQVNSSNMLWSLSGSIALVYKVLFGLQYQTDGLHFSPMVPQAMAGTRKLENLKYRNSTLDIELVGSGNKIASFFVDGVPQNQHFLSSTLTGNHKVVILLEPTPQDWPQYHWQMEVTSPETPKLSKNSKFILWNPIPQAKGYRILKDGISLGEVAETQFKVDSNTLADFQVIALSANGVESFASEPIPWRMSPQVVKPKGNLAASSISSEGALHAKPTEISTQKNKVVTFSFSVEKEGIYGISFRYANGNGPTNTDNKCALRNLFKGKTRLGTIVFPQRGNGEWSNWGWSNQISIHLKKGICELTLRFDPENENMNGTVNQALIDYMEVLQIH